MRYRTAVRRPPLVPAALWATGALWYLVAEAISARAYPGYDYARNYISDLGRPTSPLSTVMNAGFIVQGALFAAAATTLYRATPQAKLRGTFLILAICYGAGMVLVGTFHSGPQSADSSVAAVHTAGAVMALAGGNAALLVGGTSTLQSTLYSWSCRVIAVLGGTGLAALVLLAASQAGLNVPFSEAVWERVSAYTITVGELMIAGAIVGRRARG